MVSVKYNTRKSVRLTPTHLPFWRTIAQRNETAGFCFSKVRDGMQNLFKFRYLEHHACSVNTKWMSSYLYPHVSIHLFRFIYYTYILSWMFIYWYVLICCYSPLRIYVTTVRRILFGATVWRYLSLYSFKNYIRWIANVLWQRGENSSGLLNAVFMFHQTTNQAAVVDLLTQSTLIDKAGLISAAVEK